MRPQLRGDCRIAVSISKSDVMLVVLSRESGGGGKGTGLPCGRGAGKGLESILNFPIPDILFRLISIIQERYLKAKYHQLEARWWVKSSGSSILQMISITIEKC